MQRLLCNEDRGKDDAADECNDSQRLFSASPGLMMCSSQPQARRSEPVTLLMTPANLLIAPFETRMPAILEPEDIDDWLKPESKLPFELKAMLRPMDEIRMISVLLPSTTGDRVEFDAPRPEWI